MLSIEEARERILARLAPLDTETVDEFLPWDTRNVVLTLPRIWSAVATEAVYSKEEAADWAMPPTNSKNCVARTIV